MLHVEMFFLSGPDSGPGLAIVFLISLERLLIFSCFERELVLRQTARWVRQLRRLLTLPQLVAFLWFDSCWALWAHPNQPLQPFSDIFRKAHQPAVCETVSKSFQILLEC